MCHFETKLVAHTHNIAMSVPVLKVLLTFNPRIGLRWLKLVLRFAQCRERFNRITAA